MSEKNQTDPNAWMVTFADLVMLLLTFFVLLLTMSSMDTKKLESLMTHFNEATGVLEFAGSKEVSDLHTFITSYNDSASMLVIDQNMLLDTLALPESLRKMVDNLDQKIVMTDDARGIILSFHEDIIFDPGEAKIKKEVFAVLDAVAEAIHSCPNDILIMGHTDNIPIATGLYPSNWELSAHRGLAVLEYFLTQKELPPSRFAVGGYGATRPLYPNDNAEHRASNRRVEIIFKHLLEV